MTVAHRNYMSWYMMVRRCHNINADNYEYYGARGISVCARWRFSFEAFNADMGIKSEGFSVERKDNEGNYEPGNCIWADREAQMRNTRRRREITFQGTTKTVQEWAPIVGMGYRSLWVSIKRRGPENAIRAAFSRLGF